MKQLIFTFILLMNVCIFSVQGQSPYLLSTHQVPYQPLSNATSINGNIVWSIQKFTIPLPFAAKIGNTTVNQVYTDGSVLYADTTGSSADIFQYLYAYTIDRGTGTTTSKSPLRYAVTGNVGSRIFKMESLSVGFNQERQLYGTLKDSFDCQIWLYEGSNIVEIHFGNAKISHATAYFQSSGPSFCGYMNVDFSTGAGNYAYLASGDPLNADMDSLTATHMPGSFYSFPSSGTVYRFTPKGFTSTNSLTQTLPVSVYPTQCEEWLYLDYDGQEKMNFSLLTSAGAEVNIAGSLQTGKNQVSLVGLARGIYFLRIQSATKVNTLKIVKI